MGCSVTIAKQEPLELSIEIDTEICIEISTGFGSGKRGQTSSTIPISLDELGEAVDRMKDLYVRLSKATKCKHCGKFIPEGDDDCEDDCAFLKSTP